MISSTDHPSNESRKMLEIRFHNQFFVSDVSRI